MKSITTILIASGALLAAQPVVTDYQVTFPQGTFAFQKPNLLSGYGVGSGVGAGFGAGYGIDNYRQGQQALDRRDYQGAVTAFSRVIDGVPNDTASRLMERLTESNIKLAQVKTQYASEHPEVKKVTAEVTSLQRQLEAAKGTAVPNKETRIDGAMYWKAYALGKMGQRDQAQATLADLEKKFPQSRWLTDSRALAVELRASTGQASPQGQADEDLKLLALNGLISQDPDRTIPLIEKLLSDPKNPPNLKSRALYVLSQNGSNKAREMVAQYAKGASNPDLQLTAIEYMGAFRTNDSGQMLVDLYSSASDPAIKTAVIRALSNGQGSAKQLVDIARRETDPALKREVVQQLSRMKSKDAVDYMIELLNK